MWNISSIVDDQTFNEIQYGNLGAVLFIIAYIGCYGLGIIFFFGQQLKTQTHQYELPEYFLKTFWDVPSKNKLYEELADVEHLKRIFRGYFADHETYTSVDHEQLQAMVEERAYACALKYREKLRRLHLSHIDYYLDTIQRSSQASNDYPEHISKMTTQTSITKTNIEHSDDDDGKNCVLSISVV